jgi:predicted ATPase
MSDRDLSGLLIIGAYRDNEVHAGHPLQSLLSALESARVPVRRIVLAPLERETVTPLIADALRISFADAAPLATLVTAKTGGNPFFVRQFLRALEEKDLLAFDSDTGRWIWDIVRIEQETISDNVVELVTGRIGRLPSNPQRLVRLAACLGARFDLKTLAAISGGAIRDTGAGLAETLAQEIIAPVGQSYKYAPWSEAGAEASYRFTHDRVQQAAYAMTPSSKRPKIHERAGRFILESSSGGEREERLFEIVGHSIRRRLL